MRDAVAHGEERMRAIEALIPDVWRQLDQMRAMRGQDGLQWPDWCLLPMGACATLAQQHPRALQQRPTNLVAEMAALYAWRHTRSVYLMEHHLTQRLLDQVPDAVGIAELTGLPEWCIYLTGAHPEYPGGGLWAHLEHDVATGRPELRLMIDIDMDYLQAFPVYLDRESTTEALSDFRATELATQQTQPHPDVRGSTPDRSAARLAEDVDGYIGILTYLARTEADIVHAERPGTRPVKPRKAKRDTDTWLVGYSNAPS